MVALKDMISHPEDLKTIDSLPKKKRNHEKYTVYEQVDVPAVYGKKQLHFSDMGTPSKAELQKLLDKDLDLTTKLVKETQREKLKKALEDFDISDLLSNIEHFPNNSNNNTIYFTKKIGEALLKDFDFQETYESLPNFWKKLIEEKVYKWIVTSVDKNWFTVCLWKLWTNPREYVFSKKNGTRLPSIWDMQYVDVKQKSGELTSREAFDAPRKDKLKTMNIEINWYKPIFYLPKWSKKTLKGKIVSLSNDFLGNEVIFQTQDGKKFSLSLETLKEWLSRASEEYNKQKDLSTKKSVPILIKKPDVHHKKVA